MPQFALKKMHQSDISHNLLRNFMYLFLYVKTLLSHIIQEKPCVWCLLSLHELHGTALATYSASRQIQLHVGVNSSTFAEDWQHLQNSKLLNKLILHNFCKNLSVRTSWQLRELVKFDCESRGFRLDRQSNTTCDLHLVHKIKLLKMYWQGDVCMTLMSPRTTHQAQNSEENVIILCACFRRDKANQSLSALALMRINLENEEAGHAYSNMNCCFFFPCFHFFWIIQEKKYPHNVFHSKSKAFFF